MFSEGYTPVYIIITKISKKGAGLSSREYITENVELFFVCENTIKKYQFARGICIKFDI